MKILAFTDNHTLNTDILAAKAKDVDIVLSLGDMSLMGNYLNEQLKWMNDLGKPVIVIPGNHEEFADFAALCAQYPNLINLDRKVHVIDGVVFFGYGGGGFSQREREFEKLIPQFAEAVVSYPVSFLLTHGPPFDTELDYLARFDPVGHRGCKSYRTFIDTHHPTYALSGHLHETFEVKQMIGDTTVWNVGDEGVIIEV